MSRRIEGNAVRRAKNHELEWMIDRVRRAQLLKLEAFIAKGHWEHESLEFLIHRAEQELLEFGRAIQAFSTAARAENRDPKLLAGLWQEVAAEAADVCNFVAMAVDNCHAEIEWRDD